MGEIKQTNFRIDQETADKFRAFCEQHGLNQAQGFDHVMQVLELDQTKSLVPERLTEIEEFEKAIKKIMQAYLQSIEINAEAEARVREQFISRLENQEREINRLHQDIFSLKRQKEDADTAAKHAVEIQERIQKDYDSLIKLQMITEKNVKDKQNLIESLNLQLEEAVAKGERCEELEVRCRELEHTLEEERQVAREKEFALEKQHTEIVSDLRMKHQQELGQLKGELRDAQADVKAAKAEARNEIHESMEQIREKLDRRTDELIEARQQIARLEAEKQ